MWQKCEYTNINAQLPYACMQENPKKQLSRLISKTTKIKNVWHCRLAEMTVTKLQNENQPINQITQNNYDFKND